MSKAKRVSRENKITVAQRAIEFTRIQSLYWTLPLAAVLVFGAITVARAQFRGIKVLGGPAATVAADKPDVDRSEKAFPGGAPLKTDPELERLLTRADQFVIEERYDLASVLWQKVLDETGDTLVTRDGRTYTSLADEVERTLSKLPPAGLKVYRITADGEAQAALAAGVGEREEEGLSEVVRRFFVSSYGDDAAYKLGCLALDRYDFVGASRLFSKILEHHPDPSVPRGEVLLRLAVASARVGDGTAAAQMLGDIEKATGPKPNFRLVSLVKQDLEKAGSASVTATGASGDWPMSLGSPSRQGRMKGLSANFMKARLTEAWGYEFPLSSSGTQQAASGSSREIMLTRRVATRSPLATASIEQVVPRWKSQGWMPAGQLLLAGGKVYFKTNNDISCWDASAGKDDPVWRSAWLNAFQLDAYSQQLIQMYQNMGMQANVTGGRPTNATEVMLFGDQIHQSMSMSHGVVYNIEGARYDKQGGVVAGVAQKPFQWGSVPRRARRNWLAAYDANSGKARWHRSAADSEKDDSDVGFMAAPVPYGNLLLAPVSDGGAIWLYGMSRLDGKTVWKSYLCDEPSGGCAPWSPVGVSVDGRDAYVLCGAGVVFSLDAVSGQIRFGIRYRRDGKDNQMMRNMGYQASMLDLNGWSEDVVIPVGRILLVMASDHDEIFAIDRRSGEFLWRSPRAPNDFGPASYCLGVHGKSLYVAGRNVVRRYNIEGGKLVWHQQIDDSLGRGVLTDEAIYVPIGNTIAKLALEERPKVGQIVEQVDVSLTSGHPVGNLYSDGEKLWALGANRFYALTDLETRLAVLQRRINDGDSKAQFDRMLLHYTLKDYDAAIGDMLAASALAEKSLTPADAADALYRSMNQISLAQTRPVDLLKIFGDKYVSTTVELTEDLRKQRGDLMYTAMRAIKAQKTPGAAAAILRVVPLLNEDYLLASAGQALSVTASAADSEALRTATESGPPAVRIVAAETLARLVGDGAKDTIRKMLAAEQESVKLAAARALANLGERETLAVFVKLLDSPDVKIRSRSIQSLKYFTQQNLPFAAHESAEARATSVKGWQDWLAKEGEIAALRFPLPDVEPILGRTLISYYGQNLLIEFDSDGKESWRKTGVPNPWSCQGLPNGHRLVACYARNMVVEYDMKGNEIWKKEGLPGNPFSVQRLADGNTLIACSNAEKVIEVKPDGSIAWEASTPGMPRDARRLEDGRTLVALTNGHKVIEIEPSGKVVWSVEQMQGASAVQRLENGNTLITCMNARKVVEVDRAGKEVWSKTGLQQPFSSQRLQNGNTLIADQQGVVEYDSKGSAVGTKLGPNSASGVSRF